MCIVRMIVMLKRTIEGEVELETSKNILSIFSIRRGLYILGRICIPLQNSTNLYKGFEGIRFYNDTNNHKLKTYK